MGKQHITEYHNFILLTQEYQNNLSELSLEKKKVTLNCSDSKKLEKRRVSFVMKLQVTWFSSGSIHFIY